MKKIIVLLIFTILSLNLISASLCKGKDGYYHDCNNYDYYCEDYYTGDVKTFRENCEISNNLRYKSCFNCLRHKGYLRYSNLNYNKKIYNYHKIIETPIYYKIHKNNYDFYDIPLELIPEYPNSILQIF